jgi:hypothetical protein
MAKRLGDLLQRSLSNQAVVPPTARLPNAPRRHYATGAFASALFGVGVLLAYIVSLAAEAPWRNTLRDAGGIAIIVGAFALCRAWIGVRDDRGGLFAVIGSGALPVAIIGSHFTDVWEYRLQVLALGFIAFVVGHTLARGIPFLVRGIAAFTTCFTLLAFHFATTRSQVSLDTIAMCEHVAFASLAGLAFSLAIAFAMAWSVAGGLERRVNPS